MKWLVFFTKWYQFRIRQLAIYSIYISFLIEIKDSLLAEKSYWCAWAIVHLVDLPRKKYENAKRSLVWMLIYKEGIHQQYRTLWRYRGWRPPERGRVCITFCRKAYIVVLKVWPHHGNFYSNNSWFDVKKYLHKLLCPQWRTYTVIPNQWQCHLTSTHSTSLVCFLVTFLICAVEKGSVDLGMLSNVRARISTAANAQTPYTPTNNQTCRRNNHLLRSHSHSAIKLGLAWKCYQHMNLICKMCSEIAFF